MIVRQQVDLPSAPCAVWLMDSITQVTPQDAGAIVVSGSHGCMGWSPMPTRAHSTWVLQPGKACGQQFRLALYAWVLSRQRLQLDATH
jgi:hypothetical protein